MLNSWEIPVDDGEPGAQVFSQIDVKLLTAVGLSGQPTTSVVHDAWRARLRAGVDPPSSISPEVEIAGCE